MNEFELPSTDLLFQDSSQAHSEVVSSSCEIIAEIGVNHDGSFDRAIELIDAALEAGATAVKFQTFKTDRLASDSAQRVEYQKESGGTSSSQVELLQGLELSDQEFRRIARYCEKRGIEFLSTPFDADSVPFLVGLGVRRIKVGSGDLNNLPLLREIGTHGLPVILSTGMAKDDEIEEALETLRSSGSGTVTLLHCISRYPTPLQDLQLSRLTYLRERFNCPVGFSDHSMGWEAALVARSLGATFIEKHFTSNPLLEGPDHSSSADPKTFKTLVSKVREVEMILGDGSREFHPEEIEARELVRKSLVALRDIEAGEVFTEDNLAVLRPGTGIPPREWDHILGRRAAQAVTKGKPLAWSQVL